MILKYRPLKKGFYYFRHIPFCLILALAFINFNCSNLPTGDPSSNIYTSNSTSENFRFTSIAIQALKGWDINLEVVADYGNARTQGTDSFTANPPNWISVASENNCDYLGVPDSSRGQKCVFTSTNNVVGRCLLRAYTSNGEIVDTTALVNKTYFEDLLNDGMSEYEAQRKIQNTFSHEIGHCIGLQHWSDDFSNTGSDQEPSTMGDEHKMHIMYPTTSIPIYAPHTEEIAAVKAVYADSSSCNKEDSTSNCIDPDGLSNASSCDDTTIAHSTYETYHPCYYTYLSSSTIRSYHSRFPVFHISSAIGTGGSPAEKTLPPGDPITGEITTIIYDLKKDGTTEVKYIDPNGQVKSTLSNSISNLIKSIIISIRIILKALFLHLDLSNSLLF